MSALTSSIPRFDHDELIQSHPVPTLLIDGGGVVLFVNAAAEQLCNVSRSAMVGRVIYDVIAMDRGYRQRMSDATTSRSAERRVGKECVSTCRSRCSPNH